MPWLDFGKIDLDGDANLDPKVSIVFSPSANILSVKNFKFINDNLTLIKSALAAKSRVSRSQRKAQHKMQRESYRTIFNRPMPRV